MPTLNFRVRIYFDGVKIVLQEKNEQGNIVEETLVYMEKKEVK